MKREHALDQPSLLTANNHLLNRRYILVTFNYHHALVPILTQRRQTIRPRAVESVSVRYCSSSIEEDVPSPIIAVLCMIQDRNAGRIGRMPDLSDLEEDAHMNRNRKCNPAVILTAYRNHPDFAAMCREAGRLLARGVDAETVQHQIASRYGPPQDMPKQTLRQHPQPLTIVGPNLIDPSAVVQIRTALRLPPAIRGALMPDAHHGYALPVGGVVAYDRAVAPYQVGVDIGCRMHLSIFAGITPADAQHEQAHLLDTLVRCTVFGVGVPAKQDRERDHVILSDPRWLATPLLRELHEVAKLQIGTSGGGNHFAEIVVGEWLDTGNPFVGLLTHSGSRGVGAKIAKHYADLAERETAVVAQGIPRTYGWFSTESEAGQAYLMSMQLAGDYARANHEVIHRRVVQALGVTVACVVENHHNFAWTQPDGSVIHRKGATPAAAGELGIIPGSMATASYIVEGLGCADTLASASHGAGRRFSRAEATRQITREAAEIAVREAGVLVRGLTVDESPLAYKDIEEVIAAQVVAGMIRPVARMKPLVVIMSGSDGED